MIHSFHNKKILLFNAIRMGKELDETFLQCGYITDYLDGIFIKKKTCSTLRSAFSKIIRKVVSSSEFYYCPQFVTKHFTERIKKIQPDIIFAVGFLYQFFNLESVTILKRKLRFSLVLFDADTCNFFNIFNKRTRLIYFLENAIPFYDKIYSFSEKSLQFIQEMTSSKCVFFPFDAKPTHQLKLDEEEIDFCFVGSADMRKFFLLNKDRNLAIDGNR